METEETFVLDQNGEKIFGMRYARNNCKRCFGRGFSGTNFLTKEKIMCRCLKFIRKVEGVNEKAQSTTSEEEVSINEDL